jgi:ankyrin repeat protein
MISCGLDTEIMDSYGATAVMHACDWERPTAKSAIYDISDCLQLLVRCGANVHMCTPLGEHALLKSVRNGNIADCHFLLDAGCDPCRQDAANHITCLQQAYEQYIVNVGKLGNVPERHPWSKAYLKLYYHLLKLCTEQSLVRDA